ncbi:MAG: amidohydrolase [Bacteroidales bacterium]
MNTKQIISLRHELHQHPELSNAEIQTSRRIAEFMSHMKPDEVIPLGSTGFAFVFNGKLPGKCLMFRAELDALPIREESGLTYASISNGVAHACGHDGHMAIVAGLAQKIVSSRPVKGRVVLLFQPAEEVEQGARDVVENPLFSSIAPDMVFALHNIPGAESNHVLLRSGTFAAASKGVTVRLTGKTSHAAEPEKGLSPVKAIAQIIDSLDRLKTEKELFREMVLLTIIGLKMGDTSFGTTPGNAELMITLRAFRNDDMEVLTRYTEEAIQKIAREQFLGCSFAYCEDFPAVVNDPACVRMVLQAAEDLGLITVTLGEPFRWSEDFSYFTSRYPGCLFGIGGGKNHAQLHNPDYDFPDEIIETGVNIFFNIYQNTNL